MTSSHRNRLSICAVAACALLFAGCQEYDGNATNARAPAVASSSSALTTDEVLPTGGTCSPNGAHGKHAFTACSTCHVCGGVLQFDPSGSAVASDKPAPSFDATAKTCSNVACHGVPSGTFTYWFPDGTGEPAQNTVPYGSTAGTTPSWYLTGGATCTGCHGNPPASPTGGKYVWHSGYHGGQGPTGTYNQCQFCHPDAVSTTGVATGLSTATNCTKNGVTVPCASLHADGTVQVAARFTSACFGCH